MNVAGQLYILILSSIDPKVDRLFHHFHRHSLTLAQSPHNRTIYNINTWCGKCGTPNECKRFDVILVYTIHRLCCTHLINGFAIIITLHLNVFLRWEYICNMCEERERAETLLQSPLNRIWSFILSIVGQSFLFDLLVDLLLLCKNISFLLLILENVSIRHIYGHVCFFKNIFFWMAIDILLLCTIFRLL